MRATLIVAALALASCGDSEPAANQQAAGPPPVEMPPLEAEQGADITDSASRLAANQDGTRMFNRRCGVCHLAGGMGTNVLTPRVGPENALLASRPGGVPADYVQQVVRNGLGAMPGLSRVEVTDAELDAIAAYLAEDEVG
ncbi:MAG: cytochrome c [Sphingomonadaceae bacterium]|nr:cytochrome c [Sphingomonadaceae bacterium]